MEILLLIKLIEKLDGLTQKSIGRAIDDFERFLVDPAAYLASSPVVIGPRRRYLARTLIGLVSGYVGVVAAMVATFLATEALQIPQAPPLHAVVAPLLLGTLIVAFLIAFRWFRGGSCVITIRGVEFRYHGQVVACPWSLFSTSGDPHLLPGKGSLLIPVAPAAVRHAVHSREGLELVHTRGLAIHTAHWKFQGRDQAVLKPVYEVDAEELAQLLLGLGRLLGRTDAEPPAVEMEPGEWESAPLSQMNSAQPLASLGEKGWVVFQLTRLILPPYCCSCLEFTHSTQTIASEAFLTSEGNIKVPVPVCYGCQGLSRRRRWKARLVGMGVALAGSIALSAWLAALNRNADVGPLLVIVLLMSLPLGAMLGTLFLHRGLVRFRYRPSQGTVSARFHNAQYADYLLSVRLQEA